METISALSAWISENESVFSGMAALLVLCGFIFTALRYFRQSFAPKIAKKSEVIESEKNHASKIKFTVTSSNPICKCRWASYCF